jgi:hypothetical protein
MKVLRGAEDVTLCHIKGPKVILLPDKSCLNYCLLESNQEIVSTLVVHTQSRTHETLSRIEPHPRSTARDRLTPDSSGVSPGPMPSELLTLKAGKDESGSLSTPVLCQVSDPLSQRAYPRLNCFSASRACHDFFRGPNIQTQNPF